MKIKLTEPQVIDAVETGEVIEEKAGKHDCTNQIVVFKRGDGKHFRFTVACSYNDGLQIYGDTVATEVRLVQKTMTVWEEVP